MKENDELKKNTKQQSQKEMKDWDSKSQSKKHRTPPRWESPIEPIEAPVQIAELESIQLGDTTFYVLYSRIVPSLLESELDDLCTDIAEKGVLVPIIVDEHYVIIDGEHRLRAAVNAGLKQIPVQVRPGLSEQEKWRLAKDLNLHRRHLTQEQIQQIVKENREKLPQVALKLRQEGKKRITLLDPILG